MHVDILGQAAVFGQGFLLGVLLGLVYDGMRTLRRSLRLAPLAFLLDLLFWLGATAGLFALTLLSDDGQVRIYHMAADRVVEFCPRCSGWPRGCGRCSACSPRRSGWRGGGQKNF